MTAEELDPEIINGADRPKEDNPAQTWRPLRLLNLYRLVLSGLFVVIAFSSLDLKPIGEHNPSLFVTISVVYLLISLANAFAITWQRPDFNTQVYIQVVVDIIAITLIMHASGGVKSGIGMLLIIAVAGGSTLLAGHAAIRLAAVAALSMLSEHVYFQLTNPLQPQAYTHAGLLGAAFFATAMLAHALAQRVRESEALAAKRGIDLANTEQLAEYVIQRMQTGVVVLDENGNIWQINDSARQLLNLPPPEGKPDLYEVCPQLADQYHLWLADADYKSHAFRATTAIAEALPRFAKLGDETGTLIFLEDTTAMTHQAQQLKLASLGRLSGSIAHEIRNPLGAISHAGQLLAESPSLDKSDLRLTEIIRVNSKRMNNIIENVLQLGRRRQSKPEQIKLKPWLDTFVDEFCRSQNMSTDLIQVEVIPEDLETEFDTSQFHQILWNLCHNGIRHSQKQSGQAQLELKAQTNNENPIPYLDIIDYGAGIAPEVVEQAFEPFFTTDSNGTGLGLYIAKELAECNQAHLTYLPAETGGSCFRLRFADPRRRRITK